MYIDTLSDIYQNPIFFFLGAATGSPLYCFHNAIYVWLHVTDIYIYIYKYIYNTSSYATIVTLNLYVNTSFLQIAVFRKL